MLELEHGVVSHFDGSAGKGYGFLEVVTHPAGLKTGESLFFHVNDGQFVEIVKKQDDIEFVGQVFPGNNLPLWRMGNPPVGEKLAFLRTPGKGGKPKASPWTYAEGYDNRVRALFEPHYRVVKVTKFEHGGPGDTSDVIWEGRGADALSRDFDIRVLGGELSDRLADSVNFAAGSTTRYHFERWDIAGGAYAPSNPGGGQLGQWVTCVDPRTHSELVQRILDAQRV